MCDVVLSMAEEGLFVPYWSLDVLDGLARNVVERGRARPEAIQRRLALMQRAFPGSLVEGYQTLIPVMTNDPADRHVLAACVVSEARTLVTFNVKDFDRCSTEPHEVEVVHPGDFLLNQLSLYPNGTRRAVEAMLWRNRWPPQDTVGTIGLVGTRRMPPVRGCPANGLQRISAGLKSLVVSYKFSARAISTISRRAASRVSTNARW